MSISMKKIIKKCLPSNVKHWYGKVLARKEAAFIKHVNKKQNQILNTLKDKSNYNVIFFMMVASNWKYDTVYQMMDQHVSMTPTVVIYPLLTYGEELKTKELRNAIQFCEDHHYNYIVPWDESKKQWIDIRKKLDPDIVFFSNPYKHSLDIYYIKNFLDCLTCYVPYSIRQERIFDTKFNTFFQNVVWRNYYESDIQLNLAKKYARNQGANVVVSGYPIIDEIRKASTNNNAWKKQENAKKRIIWAPHWTFKESSLNWSSFLIYFDFMLILAEEYQHVLQFSFKPHPLLKNTLSANHMWGVERTNQYYQKWNRLPNGQLNETDYVDLFASSDALMHDCGSFMIEYLALNKPVMYLLNSTDISERFNDYGVLAYECHYKAHTENDIRIFIENVVLKNDDPLQPKREDFCDSVLQFKDGYAADRIVSDILHNLNIVDR
jgi:hypothetical protein